MDLQTRLKQKAACYAVTFIRSGMVVGLGTGSTARFAVERLGDLLRNGELQHISGIPSSLQTEKLANRASVPLTDFSEQPSIDITIDGADEVDQELNLIKGGGGALLREKVLAQASKRTIIIVDPGKLSPHLGQQWAVPLEIVPFTLERVQLFLEGLGATVSLRKADDGTPFRTDQHNLILDADFGLIKKPQQLADQLSSRAGVLEHGLFLNCTSDLIYAEQSRIRHLRKIDNDIIEVLIPRDPEF